VEADRVESRRAVALSTVDPALTARKRDEPGRLRREPKRERNILSRAEALFAPEIRVLPSGPSGS
jgi:hypothetical protein